MKQSSDITNFTNDELEIKCTEYLRGTGYHNRISQEKPKVTVLGGLAGSGKSYYLATLKDTYAIIGDDYRLKYPRFNQIKELYGDEWVLKTNEFSAAMINKIADQALKDKKNVVIEGTFRTYEAPANTLKKFKEAGYETHAHVVLCHKAIAKARTMERYKKNEGIRFSC
ncbi:MAG: zeta toxin family protein [Neisseriaceae bacterium]